LIVHRVLKKGLNGGWEAWLGPGRLPLVSAFTLPAVR